MLPPAIQADVIDVDTAASGEQRSGLYFATWGLATKLALALAENAGPFGTFSAEMKREFDQLAMVSRYTFKRNLTVQADNPEQ